MSTFIKKSFSDRYNTEKLVFYELFGSIEEAIAREKEIKKWRREKKNKLIDTTNPKREFLNEELLFVRFAGDFSRLANPIGWD